MSTLTHSGRAAFANALKSREIYFAVGSGMEDWETTPVSESVQATKLTNEIGRCLVTDVRFVIEDPVSEIITTTSRFSYSETQTRHLLLHVVLDFKDASNSVIRETAVFVDAKTDPSLPIGQRFFTPDQVLDIGTLIDIEHVKPSIPRSPSTRETFDHVISL